MHPPPPNALSLIAYYATYSVLRVCDGQIIGPFEHLHHDNNLKPFNTKLNLFLVCRRWRAVLAPYLYEDLLIDSRSDFLASLLESSPEIGQLVRRISIPTNPAPDHNVIRNAERVLMQCPNVSHLRVFGSSSSYVPIPPLDTRSAHSLRRVELDLTHAHWDAVNIGLLLPQGSQITCLTVLGECRLKPFSTFSLDLPVLHTLRLKISMDRHKEFYELLLRSNLPSLRTLILDIPPTHFEVAAKFWKKYGGNIRTVELGCNQSFYLRQTMVNVFKGCPNATTINLPVFFTASTADITHAHVETIGLHCQPNALGSRNNPRWEWEHVDKHFDNFSKSLYPSLANILLYGDWSWVVDIEKLRRVSDMLLRRGIALHFAPNNVWSRD